MAEIAYLKNKKTFLPNSPDTVKNSLPRYMQPVVDFTKTRSELISTITPKHVTDVLYLRRLVSLFGSELVLKERHLMYNTLSLFSNENGERESSNQKRRMFGYTAWQVAISCQVSLQFS